MTTLNVQRVGGAAAILYSPVVMVFFILFIAGTELLDAETASEFLPLLAEDKGVIVAGSVLLTVAPLLVAVAGMGIFHMLRGAGSLMWIALFGFVGGGLAILYRPFVWIAMALELAPAYVEADPEAKSTLAAVGDTFETFALGADMVGAVLVAGIGVLLFSIAILQTGVVARWVGWLGIVIAFFDGWLTLLIPVSEVFEVITFVLFPGFWIWMIAVGVTALRTPISSEADAPISQPA